MKVNVGPAERFFRITIGIALLSITVVGPQTAWGYLGLVPLLTGITGWCPPYALFGVNTCKRCEKTSRA